MPRRDPAAASPSISAAWGRGAANFYNDLAKRLGYEAAAVEIQDQFLAGRRKEAAAAVPDALIDEISLIGPPERIRDRLQAWQEIAKRELGRLAGAGRRRQCRDARYRRGGAVNRVDCGELNRAILPHIITDVMI